MITSKTPDKIPCDLIGIAKELEKSEEFPGEYKGYIICNSGPQLFCNMSYPNPRPVVPISLRKDVFDVLHGLSHPGIRATQRLINSRYFWVGMNDDIQTWCRQCLKCQECKIGRHTKKEISDLPFPTQRFTDVHMDIVGPLDPPESDNTRKPRYLLTIIDSHTRWLEATPLTEITSQSICQAFIGTWVCRFGPPLNLVTDRGTQFTSELAHNLTSILGIHHIRTSAFNPRANGIVERSHRSLKASLKARGRHWLAQLPIVLLGLRMRPSEDGSSPFSRVTGEQPMVPHILPTTGDLTQLSIQLHQLPFGYIPPRKKQIQSFVPEELKSCKMVWLRIDRVKRASEAPYQGPFRVLKRHDDTFTISVRDKPVVVSINRLKPAIIPTEPTSAPDEAFSTNQVEPSTVPTGSSEPQQQTTTVASDVTTTRSGRRVKFREDPDFVFM